MINNVCHSCLDSVKEYLENKRWLLFLLNTKEIFKMSSI